MKKKYIILIILIVIYILVTSIFFHKETKKSANKDDYILFSNNVFWHYDGIHFSNVYNNTKVIGKRAFYIYENGNYKGKYNLGFNEEELYIFDKNNDSIDYEGIITGFTDNNKHKIVNLNSQIISEEDKKIIKKYFTSHKLNYNELNYDTVIKYIIDVDNNGKYVDVYAISNMFSEEKKGKGYSLIFINDSGKIYELMSDIKTNKESFSKGYEYSIENIMDLDNDNKMDFIIAKVDYGSPDVCYLLIQKEKKEYKVTKSC